MRIVDYSYQKRAAESVLKNALKTNRYIASVLAACPGSGKTTISQDIINRYIHLFPNSKIVVLTEGQNTLKNQYLDELDNAHIDIKFSYGDFRSDAQVRVGVPHSIDRLDWDSIDLLVVDEAHNFYLAPMVQNIVEKFKPSHQVLMTGSPTRYNAHNYYASFFEKKYAMYYISADELMDTGVFSEVDLDIVRTPDIKIPRQVIRDAIRKAISEGSDLSKIMIACPTIEYAKQVALELSNMGRVVSLSTSENDSDDTEIDKFKRGDTDTLIVVGKGILGFNDKRITTLFDFKSSGNLDASYQLFARVLRTHPDGDITKSYYRVAQDTKSHNNQVFMLHRIVALTDKAVFMKYNGKNKIEQIKALKIA